VIDRIFFGLGCISASIGVIAGAFGAHALRDKLSADRLAVFETAVRYQLIHALALIAVALAMTRWGGAFTTAAGWLFVVGTLLFSGSLYALSLSGVRWLGAITPLGGISFIAGWVILAWSVLKSH
jgi:uncharacterized membrane protein YgdD (TMEM256/DUF423 family)